MKANRHITFFKKNVKIRLKSNYQVSETWKKVNKI